MTIKQLRAERGLTQQQLANLAGIHINQLQRYEYGKRDISNASARVVVAIAAALGTTAEEIIRQPGE